ncbi:hypothetical protein [Halalkalibacter lacteus]|uniref:hypothetical protein n=1 Tax=Halalkalibacter lacteus TaxID=3090663 RepID=UPI002FCB379B
MGNVKKWAKNKGYESISRNMLQDVDNLSLQAIGLLSNLQSMPETWSIHKTELYKRFAKNGRTSVMSAWNELIEHKYILQLRKRSGKKYDYIYYFSHEKFTQEDIQAIEEKEGTTLWNGKIEKNKKPQEKQGNNNDYWTVDFQQSKMNSPKSTPIKSTNNEVYQEDSKETRDTKETGNVSHNLLFSSTDKEELQDQLLKDSLKDIIPQPLHHVLSVFSDSYDEMYHWFGIILKAKEKAEKFYSKVISLEDEENQHMLREGFMKAIRNLKKDQKDNPDNYLFIAIKNHIEQHTFHQALKQGQENKKIKQSDIPSPDQWMNAN